MASTLATSKLQLRQRSLASRPINNDAQITIISVRMDTSVGVEVKNQILDSSLKNPDKSTREPGQQLR
jgi:hypothetical protein